MNHVEQNKALITAVCEILRKSYGGVKYHLVYYDANVADENETCIHNYFYKHLRMLSFSDMKEVEEFLTDKTEMLRDTYGVLIFLYSVLCSRGLSVIECELNGNSEPLIDYSHGYGSQVLINLMITGNAVDNVFNNNCELDGLTLCGIREQSEIGFLTILEHLRYCEVGSYLKKPIYPVWVLGSETHLTVLFSFNKKLAQSESSIDIANRVFGQFDTDGCNFIKNEVLPTLLKELDLVHDEEYVRLITDKLDSDNLGIILKSSFMDEFFGTSDGGLYPDTFKLYHYNGQINSNVSGKVVYRSGDAVLLESDITCINDNDAILTCVQTRWPTIDIRWHENIVPSLN